MNIKERIYKVVMTTPGFQLRERVAQLAKEIEDDSLVLENALQSIVDNEFIYGMALINGEEKTPMRIAREALDNMKRIRAIRHKEIS